MRTFIILLFLVSSFPGFSQYNDPNMGIIPAPVSIKKTGGEFVFNSETLIVTDGSTANQFRFLHEFLKQNRFKNSTTTNRYYKKSPGSIIELTNEGSEKLPAEGYKIIIEPTKLTISGKGAGLFYGVQTLIQLLEQSHTTSIHLPCMEIEDYPRFSYRGMHLDVSRHFYGVAFVKQYIDLMATYKLNNFHWHLTDDQGWRIEIKKYPRLTSIGSNRAQTRVGKYSVDTAGLFDNTPYGGYYTQKEIKEVVAYAAERYINIVPEIEMPGHSMETIAAYPFLSCDPKKKYKVYENWGSPDEALCPCETTFKFLENVLTEVMQLFPSRYIHIGGDECSKTAWKNSKYCQELIKDFNLKNEEGLQSYFIRRMEKFVNSKGRSIIGWDEILEGGIAPNATIMSWRGEKGGIAAARQNHDVIMTPGSGGLYFDHRESKSDQEPMTIGGNAPLQKTYAYNPVPDSLTAEQQKHVKGVQANLWTEYIATEAKVEYMLLPRMLALAEIAWTPPGKKSFSDFSEERIPRHLAKFDSAGHNFRVPTAIGAIDTTLTGPQFRIALKTPVSGAKIYYTIDGFKPRETDLQYTKPLDLSVPTGKEMTLQTIVVTASGKRSIVTKTVLSNK